MEFVKHPIYRSEKLDGKIVAVCEVVHFEKGSFHVGKVRADGFHELSVVYTALIQEPNSEKLPAVKQWEVSMGQDDVNKIVALESSSILGKMGFDFAVVRDSESASLAKVGHWKTPT
jgi:hypothetical protein